MTSYLCTCGTSAAKNLPRDPRFDADWVRHHGGIEAAADVVYDSFRHFAMDDEQALRAKLSAEIHSLARMQVDATDDVVLFSSETPDGQACAEAVKRYLEAARPGLRCRVRVIPGLQVTDAERFRTTGVLEFTKAVLDEIAANGAQQCVLNPTGGFKSLVPYTVLIGMLKGITAKYIFEQSSALIPLPMMPVEFARERLEPLQPILERIERESAIPRAALAAAIPFAERDWFEPLFETLERDQVTLSPVGFLIRAELATPSALVPYLSRPAIDDLLRMRNIEGTEPDAYLSRVARVSEQLEVGRHAAWSDALFWLKPGQHTRDRYLVSVEGWRLLVWRILDHYGEYQDRLQDRTQGARIIADRRRRYEPFVRMDLYEAD